MPTSYQDLDDKTIHKLLKQQQQNLSYIERQLAHFGPNLAPLSIINQAEAVRLELEAIKSEVLRREYNHNVEFKDKAALSLTELDQLLAPNYRSASGPSATSANPDPHSIPKAPAFYAEPSYIGSHKFVGRDSQLQELSDWAKPADPTNLLLFEGIGGNGKSMLTWEWTTNHATRPRRLPSHRRR